MFERFLENVNRLSVVTTANRYAITLDGEIRGVDGTVIPQKLDENDELVVWGDFFDGWGFYKVGVLMALTFKRFHGPLETWKHLNVMYRDGDKRNLHPSNLVWKFPKGGLIHPKFPGFAIIPGFSRYVTDVEGNVFNHVTSGKCSTSINKKYGYRTTTLTPDIGKSITVGRHRLLCLAWKEYSANVDKLDVNHIDGIPGSDALDNLEWLSRSGNMNHAYKLGLRFDNHPVLMRDCVSGEITEFHSYEECARQLNMPDGETIRLRAKTNGQPVYPGLKQFKRKDDVAPWRIPENPSLELIRGGVANPVIVRNIMTGELIRFNSAILAGKHMGVNPGSVIFHLDTKVDKYPINGYDVQYDNDTVVWPKWTFGQIEHFKANPFDVPKAVRVVDLKSEETHHFHNAFTAANVLDVKLTDLRAAAGRLHLLKKRWKASYVEIKDL